MKGLRLGLPLVAGILLSGCGSKAEAGLVAHSLDASERFSGRVYAKPLEYSVANALRQAVREIPGRHDGC